MNARRPSLVIATIVALLALPAAGWAAEDVSIQSGAGGQQLVIKGSDGGDHVTIGLDSSGSDFVLNGYFPGSVPGSCQAEKPQKKLLCRTAGITEVLVDLGAANDKLEILDPLPSTVIAHLGSGNDRMSGNGEPDTCYMDGGAKKQCLLGGGDDTCIGGPGRGDCYGGPGNDSYAAMANPDGFWGGQGADVCRMGPGNDECYGDAGNDLCSMGGGNDLCQGGPGDDVCRGGGGNDACEGEGGNDTLIGGPGIDRILGGAGRDSCDAGPGPAHVRSCESGPG
ncbi:MAG: hypothetical protein M3O76_00975 [Actinomycetota bacterium]|nr:hypothetical protein [Actinomycetota bacterium]